LASSGHSRPSPPRERLLISFPLARNFAAEFDETLADALVVQYLKGIGVAGETMFLLANLVFARVSEWVALPPPE
jgi:hypothetical protein